jgi:hypothetical protein
MGANQLQSKALALEPVEVPAPAAEPARPVAATPRAENKTQRELRITTADEFLATAAREYEEGTVDQALWRRAVEQCRDNPSLVVAAYLRARATELKSRHNAEASVAEDRADEDPNRDEPGGQPSAMVSTFLRGIAPDSPKSKVVWWAAAAVALAAVVAVIFIMVSPPAREPDQGRTAAVAATASPQPAVPARAQPATRAPGSEANGDQTRVALAATVQRLRNDGNWNVLVLYAAEWTRKEPENAVAWRELSGGYARLHQYNDALDAGNRADGRYEILSDGARRLTERPGELEGDRDREVTQCAVGWRFHRERWNLVY